MPIDDVEQRLQASDVTLYMIGQGRGRHDGAAEEESWNGCPGRPAAARCSPTASTSCTTRSTICSTSCRTSIFSDTRRPTSVRDDTHQAHQGERGRPVSGSRAAGIPCRAGEMRQMDRPSV